MALVPQQLVESDFAVLHEGLLPLNKEEEHNMDMDMQDTEALQLVGWGPCKVAVGMVGQLA